MTMPASRERRPSVVTVSLWGAGFLGLWVILIGSAPKDLLMGVAAAAAATGAAIALWPPDASLSASGLMRFIVRFLPQSAFAGMDVARRAFARTPDLDEGIVAYRTALPPGMARGALCAVMSLQPGKLPVDLEADGTLHIHCLDIRQPVTAELAADEAAFLRILRDGTGRE